MVACLAALAGIVAGCGESSGESSQVSASAEVDKVTFLKKAEAVCRRANANTQEDFSAFVKQHGGESNAIFEDPQTSEEFATTVVLANKKAQVEGLKELSAPEADQKKVEEIVAAYQEGIDVGEEDPSKVTSPEGVFKYAAKVAQDFGLEECRW